ncbi:MAG: aminoacyl-tRNA hydrolase [Coriobacteriales bacterium]|jgi:PTH1 family peptidyl-tRNA hydrolase|nr:aminoacyl-tRNA hydrolase [Coriobacteriales bacterium]
MASEQTYDEEPAWAHRADPEDGAAKASSTEAGEPTWAHRSERPSRSEPIIRPRLIVGLGNPGREYEHTRHNAGFATIDAFAAEMGVNYWKIASNALVGEMAFRGEKVVLAKPQSFMNLSGGPVKGLCARYGISPVEVLIIHDELDLPAGVLKLKRGGGHAGHNGLRSLHHSLGADYARLRVGIGRPSGRMPARAYVLQVLRSAELEEFELVCARAASVVLKVLEDGLVRAMNDCNAAPTGEGGSADGSAGGSAGGSAAASEGSGQREAPEDREDRDGSS